jgi:hypothetical protein
MSPVGKVDTNFWKDNQVSWRKEESWRREVLEFRNSEPCVHPEEQPEIVRALLAKDLPLDFIKEATGLSEAEILALR